MLKEEWTSHEIKGVVYIYRTTSPKTREGKEYKVISLEGCERISTVTLNQDTLYRNEPISGKVELKNWKGEVLAEANVVLTVRPIGKIRELLRLEKNSVRGVAEFQFEKALELPGTFEVASTLKGYANIPASLIIL